MDPPKKSTLYRNVARPDDPQRYRLVSMSSSIRDANEQQNCDDPINGDSENDNPVLLDDPEMENLFKQDAENKRKMRRSVQKKNRLLAEYKLENQWLREVDHQKNIIIHQKNTIIQQQNWQIKGLKKNNKKCIKKCVKKVNDVREFGSKIFNQAKVDLARWEVAFAQEAQENEDDMYEESTVSNSSSPDEDLEN